MLKVFEQALLIKRGAIDLPSEGYNHHNAIIAALGSRYSGKFGHATVAEIHEASGENRAFSYLPDDTVVLFNTVIVEDVKAGGDYAGATRAAASGASSSTAFRFARVYIREEDLDGWRFVSSTNEATAIESRILFKAAATRTATRTADTGGTDAPEVAPGAAKLGFYGVVRRSTGRFHIVDLELRKNAWGRVCEFFHVPDLVRYVLKLDSNATIATVMGSEGASKRMSDAIASTVDLAPMDAVNEYVGGIRDLDTASLSNRRKREIYLFGRLKKPSICKYIRTELSNRDLLVSA